MRKTDVERYKASLLEMRSRLIREVAGIQEAIIEDVTAPGDISTAPTHLADFDAEGIDRNLAVAENEAHILQDVEAALERIERGSYGTCQECGDAIRSDRLDAIPFTPYCVQCAEQVERSQAEAEGR